MLFNKNLTRNVLLLFSTIIMCIYAAEITIKNIYADRLEIQRDERNLTYRYDSTLGWFPVENSSKQFMGSRLIHVQHNSRGFRDAEHFVGENPRIMVLGDSFVWGYDVEVFERFTEKLNRRMPNWSVYNLGVSGYGTDQEYLLLQKHHDYYRPNIVFLVFCTDTDFYDNTHNNLYGGYYKPYFVMHSGGLELRGTPVPKSENYFFVKYETLSKSYVVRLMAKTFFRWINPPALEIDNPTYEIIAHMNELSKDKGFLFVVGLQERNVVLEYILARGNIPYITLSNPFRYPSHGYHWTPEGHTFVADRIYDFFKENNIF